MVLQYSPFFKLPRKLFKYFLSFLYPLVVKLFPLPKVKSISQTINKIHSDKVSICRFGDGELLYVCENRSLPFQEQNERLRNYFIEILKSNYDHILVGFVSTLFSRQV